MDDAQQTPNPLDLLTLRVIGLEALVGTLGNQPSKYDDQLSSNDEGSPTPTEQKRTPTGEDIDLESLTEWVTRIHVRYAAAGDWLRPCWWRHGFVVEELAALWIAWMGVYESVEPPAATAALKWHEDAAKCRERIRRAISTGPGCTAVTHKPDQSAINDPRWSQGLSSMTAHGDDACPDAMKSEDPSSGQSPQ
jgi:hypothetical protein